MGKWVNSWFWMSQLLILLHQVALIKALYATGNNRHRFTRQLIHFQPMALEIQGSLGESSEIFISCLCKMLRRSHDSHRAGNFLKQQVSLVFQIGIAACVLGTVSDRDELKGNSYI